MRALVALSLLLFAALTGAQNPADALRGTAAPIAAKDLPESFRAVSLGGDPSGGFGIYGFAFAASGAGPDQARSSLLFSLLGVTFVDPDEFAALLDGKRARIRGYGLDFPGMVLSS